MRLPFTARPVVLKLCYRLKSPGELYNSSRPGQTPCQFNQNDAWGRSQDFFLFLSLLWWFNCVAKLQKCSLALKWKREDYEEDIWGLGISVSCNLFQASLYVYKDPLHLSDSLLKVKACPAVQGSAETSFNSSVPFYTLPSYPGPPLSRPCRAPTLPFIFACSLCLSPRLEYAPPSCGSERPALTLWFSPRCNLLAQPYQICLGQQ